MIKPISLEDHVIEAFMLINTRRRCEFLANFPPKGTTLKNIVEGGILGTNKSTVHFYLQQYGRYIDKPERQDNKHRKILTLNTDGKYLQKAARYIMAIAYEMNQLFNAEVDYLRLFLPRSNPNEMITVMYKIFTNTVEYRAQLYRWKGDSNTGKIVDRLSEFDLIKVQEGRGRASSLVHSTKAGPHYYRKLLCPVLEYLAGNSQGRDAVHVSNGAVWGAYLQAIKAKAS